jgi:hypothetical protein
MTWAYGDQAAYALGRRDRDVHRQMPTPRVTDKPHALK